MNWSLLLIAFSLAVLMGASLARFIARSWPEWTARRRLLTAASVLPSFTLLTTIVGVVWVLVSGPRTGENMQDLAVVATAAIGGFFAVLAFIGSFVGASLAQQRPGR